MSGGDAGASVFENKESIIDLITNQIPGRLKEYTKDFSEEDKKNAAAYLNKKEVQLPTFTLNEPCLVDGLTSVQGLKLNGRIGKVVGPTRLDGRAIKFLERWDDRYEVTFDDVDDIKLIPVKNLQKTDQVEDRWVCVNPFPYDAMFRAKTDNKAILKEFDNIQTKQEYGVCKPFGELSADDKEHIYAKELYKKVQSHLKKYGDDARRKSENQSQFESRMNGKYADFLDLDDADGNKYTLDKLIRERKEEDFKQFEFKDKGTFDSKQACLRGGSEEKVKEVGTCWYEDRRKDYSDPNSSYEAWRTLFEEMTESGQMLQGLNLFNGEYDKQKRSAFESLKNIPDADNLRETLMEYLHTIAKLLCYDIQELKNKQSDPETVQKHFAFVEYAKGVDAVFSNPTQYECFTALRFLRMLKAGLFRNKERLSVKTWIFGDLHRHLLRVYEIEELRIKDPFFWYYSDQILRLGFNEIPFQEYQGRCKMAQSLKSIYDFIGGEETGMDFTTDYDEDVARGQDLSTISPTLNTAAANEKMEAEYYDSDEDESMSEDEDESEQGTVLEADGPLNKIGIASARGGVNSYRTNYSRTIDAMRTVYMTVGNRYEFFKDLAEYLAGSLDQKRFLSKIESNAKGEFDARTKSEMQSYGDQGLADFTGKKNLNPGVKYQQRL